MLNIHICANIQNNETVEVTITSNNLIFKYSRSNMMELQLGVCYDHIIAFPALKRRKRVVEKQETS